MRRDESVMSGIIGKTRALFSRRPLQVDKALAVRLIGDAWITFVTKTLTTTDTLGHPDIAEELFRLEESGSLSTLRSERHIEVENVLSELLSCPVKARTLVCHKADIRLLALALDRVQSITFRFVETGRPDREPPVYALQPLLELFHQMLLDDTLETK
jgi:hypothetical protein